MAVLCAQIAGLALTRRLGRAGVAVGLLDSDPQATAFGSRYCRVSACAPPKASDAEWLLRLEGLGEQLEAASGVRRPALLATSDPLLLLLSRHRERLAPRFRLLLPAAELIEALLDKRRMHRLAAAYLPASTHVTVPRTLEVASESELLAAGRELGFPCLLKSAYSQPAGRLFGTAEAPEDPSSGKLRVADIGSMRRAYARLAPLDPRLMVQEYLAGGCERVALYNAYFDHASRPVVVFTGRKLRQYPIEFGTACLSEACPMPGLAEPLTAFFQSVGYIGAVDVGLKFDPRTRHYKILDVNPRLGQNYRTYVTENGLDLGWLAYSDMAGDVLPGGLRPRRRRWAIEDHDWRTCRRLLSSGELGLWSWLASYRGLRETAYWNWRDPLPFLRRLYRPFPAAQRPPAIPVRPEEAHVATSR